MMDEPALRRCLEVDGFAIVPNCVAPGVVDELISHIIRSDSTASQALVRRRGKVFAMRNLVDVIPAVSEVFRQPVIRALLRATVGEHPYLVRSILFDKTAAANWHVSWHQDLSIAVRERVDVAGYGPWSTKAGAVHVQPPCTVLEAMLTLRISLDEGGADQGALRVLPGSHRHGRLGQSEIERMVQSLSAITCGVSAGGAVLMKPLLLHSSRPAVAALHRRVLHFELAPEQLPPPLEWIYPRIGHESGL